VTDAEATDLKLDPSYNSTKGASCPVVRASISFHRQPEIVRGLVQFHKSVAVKVSQQCSCQSRVSSDKKVICANGDNIIQNHSDDKTPRIYTFVGGLRLRFKLS